MLMEASSPVFEFETLKAPTAVEWFLGERADALVSRRVLPKECKQPVACPGFRPRQA
jgi:hypothetical protein